METAWQRISKFNRENNRLPQKALIVLLVLLLVFLFTKIFPFIAPFVVALVLSFLMSPLVRLLGKACTKLHLPRFLATLLSMIIVLGLVLTLTIMVISQAFVELKGLANSLPRMVSDLVTSMSNEASDGLNWLAERVELLTPEVMTVIQDGVNDLGRSVVTWASGAANFVARRAVSTAISIPQILLFLMLTIMSTFYMSHDRERILSYLGSQLPDRVLRVLGEMKRGMLRAVLGQMKAELILTLVLFIELLVGFMILGIRYAVLLALVVAILGPLPVLGPGMVLVPWSIWGFVTGDLRIGVGMLLLFLITNIMRELLAPRVMSTQLGIYPLVTMVSMYAGFVWFGVFGMLIGPIVFMLCRVAVLAVDTGAGDVPPPPSGVDLMRERAQRTMGKWRALRKKKEEGPKDS